MNPGEKNEANQNPPLATYLFGDDGQLVTLMLTKDSKFGPLRKTIAALVIAVTIHLTVAAQAQGGAEQSTEEQTHALRIKARVQKIGAGEKSKIRVKLRVGTELRGYVSSISNDSFEVTDSASGKAASVQYADVESVKGKGLSTSAKVLVIIGIGLGIVVAIVAIHGVHPVIAI